MFFLRAERSYLAQLECKVGGKKEEDRRDKKEERRKQKEEGRKRKEERGKKKKGERRKIKKKEDKKEEKGKDCSFPLVIFFSIYFGVFWSVSICVDWWGL